MWQDRQVQTIVKYRTTGGMVTCNKLGALWGPRQASQLAEMNRTEWKERRESEEEGQGGEERGARMEGDNGGDV